MQRFLLCSQFRFSLLVSTLFHANTLGILLLANKLAGSVVESNYHISFAAVELSLVMIRIVPTTDRLEVAHPT